MVHIIKLDANEHPIKSVTVFKSNKAEVVRIFKVSLEEGQSKIQIRHLPGSIDTESARVTGLGDAQLFDVVCSIGPGIDEIDTASTAEVVRKLNARKDVLSEDLDAIGDISETIVTYSKSLAGDSVPPDQAERFFEGLMSRSRAMTSARAELEEEILQLSRQIDMLSSAEKKRQGKTDGEVSVVIMAKKATNIELRLTYLVRNATWSAVYELHATTEAGVPASSVSLHYRARITQSTGEDWTDVKLTLSTADMDLSNKTIPVLIPTKIRSPRSLFGFGADGHVDMQSAPVLSHTEKAVMHSKARRRFGGIRPNFAAPGGSDLAFRQALAQMSAYDNPSSSEVCVVPGPGIGSSGAWLDESPRGGPPDESPRGGPPRPAGPPRGSPMPAGPSSTFVPTAPRALARKIDTIPAERHYLEVNASISVEELTTAIGEPVSVIHKSPLALTYHVEGASGVPSDGVPHQVSIAVLPFEAKTQHVTVPKVQPVAYLQATVKNTSDYRLIPGTVHVFVDDSFVSRTSIVGDVAPGDEFSCTLGTDPATRISYVCTTKNADDADAPHERSAVPGQWAATRYRSSTTVRNRHPFAVRELLVRDSVPVSEDEKRVSVVLRQPAGLAELEQKGELRVSAEDSEREDKGEKQTQKQTQTVRWSKVVDGMGGKKEGLFEWVVEVEAGEELTIETEWDVKAPVPLGRFERVRNRVSDWLRWKK